MAKLTSSMGICFVSSNLYEIHITVQDRQTGVGLRTGAPTDVPTYASNLIYDVRLQVNMGDIYWLNK